MAIQREEIVARIRAEEGVLLIQGTTSFNFSHHPLDFIVRASDYRSFTPKGQSLFQA